jgi:hypothetical protein
MEPGLSYRVPGGYGYGLPPEYDPDYVEYAGAGGGNGGAGLIVITLSTV